MLNRAFFSKRLNLLKVSHELSNATLSSLLNLKSKGSISAFEGMKGLPSLDVFVDIAALFAITTDWLIAYSNSPYNQEVLLHFENQHIDRVLSSSNNSIPDFSLAYINGNDTYLDPISRAKHFSLPLRANIIFILNRLKFETDKFAALDQPLQTIWPNFEDFKKHALPPLLDGYQFYKLAKRDNVQQLHDLFTLFEKIMITKEIKSPVFDIQKLSATHKKNG